MIATVASRGAAEQDSAYRPAPAELSRRADPSRGLRDTVLRIFLFSLRQFRGVKSSDRTPLRLRLRRRLARHPNSCLSQFRGVESWIAPPCAFGYPPSTIVRSGASVGRAGWFLVSGHREE